MSEIKISDVGFEWGSAIVERIGENSDGTVHMHIVTPIYRNGLNIWVDKTGSVIIDYQGEEWGPY